jgi:hypothetical protein
MNSATNNEPVYIFRLTPEISLIWTVLGTLLLIISGAAVSWFYQTIHGQSLNFSIESSPLSIRSVIFIFASLLL